MDAMSEYLADLASKGEEVSPFDKPAAQVPRQKKKDKKDLYTPPGVNRRGCKQFRDLSWVQQVPLNFSVSCWGGGGFFFFVSMCRMCPYIGPSDPLHSITLAAAGFFLCVGGFFFL
jgi:hypothetical protein